MRGHMPEFSFQVVDEFVVPIQLVYPLIADRTKLRSVLGHPCYQPTHRVHLFYGSALWRSELATLECRAHGHTDL